MKNDNKTSGALKQKAYRIIPIILTVFLISLLLQYPVSAEETYVPEEAETVQSFPDNADGEAELLNQDDVEPEEMISPEDISVSEVFESFEEIIETEEIPVVEPAEEPVEIPEEEPAGESEVSADLLVTDDVTAQDSVLVTDTEELLPVEERIEEQDTEKLDSQLEFDHTLSVGDTGSDVIAMQTRLAELGYLGSNLIDGDYGTVTQKAVKKFQMYHGLSMTGTADLETLTRLSSSSTSFYGLSVGSSGTAVLGMQTLLYDLGYLDFAPDGDYGPRTAGCVKEFQKANGLYEDGVAGAYTIDALTGSPAAYSASGEIGLGSTGKDVVEIQERLIALGYLPSVADGDFGRVTQAAVIAFQAACGISSPDGSVGPVTRELLKKAGAFQSLQNGSNSIAVQVMQKKLISLGYLGAYGDDGDFGNVTKRAVKKYQMYNNLPITGVADANTLNSLYRSESAFYGLSVGSNGTAAAGLQQLLYDLGYLDIAPDGDYGPYTAQAVKAFQKANNLYVDGVAGAYTIEVLVGSPTAYSAYVENATVEYGGTYVITIANGGRALEVADSSVYSGANVELDAYQEYGCQKWVMQNAGDGYYYIRNLRSWKVLELEGGNAQQGEWTGSAAQKWKITKAAGGGYHIINSNGSYLGGSSGNATGGTTSQVWYMEETDPGTALDFKTNGTQYLGIRTFNINQGNVTETSGYYNLETEIDLPSGGYYLSGGDNYSIGLKVMYVNSYLASAGYLDWGYYNYNRYDGNTVWAVKQFQSDYGLYVDGIVGLQTWKAMGYSEYDWYNLGSYTTGLKVYAYGSSRDTYVNAMLNTAYEYASAGTGFADGASGKPGTYVDCSGLIFQCLYAAGLNPDVNIIDHARVVYEYTSNYLGNDWQMGVAVASAQPGDLIFYGDSSINHVAIYAGNGMIYDSWPGIGVTYRNMYSGGNIIKIVRVF